MSNQVFPLDFAKPTEHAVAWDEAGRPAKTALTPIYTRNTVSTRIAVMTGGLIIKPFHQELILVDGIESPIGEPQEGWREDGSSVNPAKWAEPSESGPEATIALAYDVDPDLAEKIRETVETFRPQYQGLTGAEEVRGLRVNHALNKTFEDFCKRIPAHEGAVLVEDTDRHEWSLRRLADGRIVFNLRWGWGSVAVPCRVENGEVTYSTADDGVTQERVQKLPEKKYCDSRRGEKCPSNAKYCPGHELPIPTVDSREYREWLDELKTRLSSTRVEAENAPLVPLMPAERKNRDRKPLPQKFPQQLSIAHSAGTLANQSNIDHWYDCAVALAVALGYKQVGRESSSRTGRSRSSEWMLPGGADIKSLVPEATRIDEQRGIIVVPKTKMGIVIGTRGARINSIRELTGRNWQLQSA